MTSLSNLPHVTAIIRDAGLVDTTWFTDHMRERGTALHLACEFFDKRILDSRTVDKQIKPAFDNYMKFKMEVDPEILAVEEEVEYPGLYCGRLDRRVKINGVEGIVDLKGQPSPVDRLQLAGYAMTFSRPMNRWNLYLRVGTNYKLVQHKKHREDDADFKAAIRIADFRRRNGMHHQEMKSSNIETIGYDEGSKTMEVRFKGGGLYKYFDVPVEAHQKLVGAKSCGQCFSADIKGKYKYQKVGGGND